MPLPIFWHMEMIYIKRRISQLFLIRKRSKLWTLYSILQSDWTLFESWSTLWTHYDHQNGSSISDLSVHWNNRDLVVRIPSMDRFIWSYCCSSQWDGDSLSRYERISRCTGYFFPAGHKICRYHQVRFHLLPYRETINWRQPAPYGDCTTLGLVKMTNFEGQYQVSVFVKYGWMLLFSGRGLFPFVHSRWDNQTVRMLLCWVQLSGGRQRLKITFRLEYLQGDKVGDCFVGVANGSDYVEISNNCECISLDRMYEWIHYSELYQRSSLWIHWWIQCSLFM